MRRATGVLGLALVMVAGGAGLWWLLRVPAEAAGSRAAVLRAATPDAAGEDPGLRLAPLAGAPEPQPLASAGADVGSEVGPAGSAAAGVPSGRVSPEERIGFRLHIVDAWGHDVEAALIEAWDSDDDIDEEPARTGSTDATGCCSIVAPVKSVLVASKPGLGTTGLLRVNPRNPWSFREHAPAEPDVALTPVLEGVLHEQARLTGRVSDESGQPARGARLYLALAAGEGMTGLPRERDGLRVDEEGRFDVLLDAPSSGSVRADRDAARSRSEPLDLQPGATTSLELRLGDDYRITGTITGPDGQPPAVFPVRVRALPVGRPEVVGSIPVPVSFGSEGGRSGWTATADAWGRYSLPLDQPCDVVVSALASGLMSAESGLGTVDAQHPHAVVDLRLVAAADLTGRLLLDSGEPVAGERVRILPEGTDLGTHWKFGNSGGSDHTGEDGTFRLGNTDPGRTYTLDVSSRWQPRRLLHVPGGARDVDFVVTRVRPVDLIVRVTDGRTHAPIPVAAVKVLNVTPLREFRDAGGEFHLDVDPLPEAYVLVAADGYTSTIAGPFAIAGEVTRVDVAVGRAGSLVVRVLDAQGRPAPGVTVSLAPLWMNAATGPLKPVAAQPTGTDGSVSFSELAPTLYWVSAFADGARGGPLAVTVPSEDTARATLTLSAGEESGALELSLREAPDGAAITYVVRASPAEPDEHRDPTERIVLADAAGRALLAPLPPGLYSITLVRNGLERASTNAIVPPGATVPVRFDPY